MFKNTQLNVAQSHPQYRRDTCHANDLLYDIQNYLKLTKVSKKC